MGLFSSIGKIVGSVTGGDVLGLAGGLLGNDASAKQAQAANSFTKEQMQNKHQWEAADLRAAGRNPILYSGSNPSMGSSAMAQQQNPFQFKPAQDSANASSKQANTQENLSKSQIELLGAQTQTAKAQAQQASTAAMKNVEDANLSRSEQKRLNSTLAQTALESANSAKSANTWWSRHVRPRTKAFGDSLQDFNPLKGWKK